MQRRTAPIDWILTVTMVAGVSVLLGKDQVAGLISAPKSGVGLTGVVLASTAFVLVGLRSLWRERNRLSILLFIGLALCWTGDVVGYIGYFVPSAVSFLVGHLVYASGFAMAGLERPRFGVAVGAVAVSSGLLAWWLLPHVSTDMRVLVIGYMAVISAMVATACGTRHPNVRLLAVAACLFYVSDIAVAHWKFVSGSRWSAFFCYPLYYPACLLLAFGSRVPKVVAGEERS